MTCLAGGCGTPLPDAVRCVLPCSFVGYAGLMDKCALQLCQLLRTRAASGEEIDIWQALGRMTLQVGGRAVGWCSRVQHDAAGVRGCGVVLR